MDVAIAIAAALLILFAVSNASVDDLPPAMQPFDEKPAEMIMWFGPKETAATTSTEEPTTVSSTEVWLERTSPASSSSTSLSETPSPASTSALPFNCKQPKEGPWRYYGGGTLLGAVALLGIGFFAGRLSGRRSYTSPASESTRFLIAEC